MYLQWNTITEYKIPPVRFVISFPDDLAKRYNDLEAAIAERSQDLQGALADSRDVQDNIKDLLDWLDRVESQVRQVEKGTVLVVKRAPLVENLQEQKVGKRYWQSTNSCQ